MENKNLILQKISDNVSNVLTNIYNQFSKENLNFNLSNDLLLLVVMIKLRYSVLILI